MYTFQPFISCFSDPFCFSICGVCFHKGRKSGGLNQEEQHMLNLIVCGTRFFCFHDMSFESCYMMACSRNGNLYQPAMFFRKWAGFLMDFITERLIL